MLAGIGRKVTLGTSEYADLPFNRGWRNCALPWNRWPNLGHRELSESVSDSLENRARTRQIPCTPRVFGKSTLHPNLQWNRGQVGLRPNRGVKTKPKSGFGPTPVWVGSIVPRLRNDGIRVRSWRICKPKRRALDKFRNSWHHMPLQSLGLLYLDRIQES